MRGELLYTPLGFLYPNDGRAKEIEDQLFVGGSIMIAPVYRQNEKGRLVYLPESMKMVKIKSVTDYREKVLPRGDHYIEIGFDETVFFIAPGKALPLANPVSHVEELDDKNFLWLKNSEGEVDYELYTDDGVTADIRFENIKTIKIK